MKSQWATGAIALGAIAVAVECFALVDATLGDHRPCGDALGGCLAMADVNIPLVVAMLGTLAAAVAVIPALIWIAADGRRRRAELESELDAEERKELALVPAGRREFFTLADD